MIPFIFNKLIFATILLYVTFNSNGAAEDAKGGEEDNISKHLSSIEASFRSVQEISNEKLEFHVLKNLTIYLALLNLKIETTYTNKVDSTIHLLQNDIKDVKESLAAVNKSETATTKLTSEIRSLQNDMKNFFSESGTSINTTNSEIKSLQKDINEVKKIQIQTEKKTAKLNSEFEKLNDYFNGSDLPKSMQGHVYVVSPNDEKNKTIRYCETLSGKPFIPKTQEEFDFYLSMTADIDMDAIGWYPMNDIKEEGHVVLDDGTDYEKSIYKIENWEINSSNDAEHNCVAVRRGGSAFWYYCDVNFLSLLCQLE